MWNSVRRFFGQQDEHTPADETRLTGELGADRRPEGSSEQDRGASARGARSVRRAGTTYVVRSHDTPQLEASFAHGHIDGADGIEREPFEGFVAERVECDRLAEEIDVLKEEQEALRTREAQISQLWGELAENRELIGELEERTSAARDELNTTRKRLEEHNESSTGQTPARGSVLYMLVYTIAGLFFIAGDVIMSREVVAEALRLQGDVEPWIFALGLAMLAVLMKPAYDRLVEKPYWEGKKRAFRWVIVGGVVAASVTLFVLGAFRSEAFVSQSEIGQLQSQLSSAGSVEELNKIQERISALQNDVVDSGFGFASFVLSGLIFAAAGAVCLGIGFQHGRDWYHGFYRPRRRRRRLHKDRDALRERLEQLQDRLAHKRAELERAQLALDNAPSLEELQQQLGALKSEEKELRAQLAQHREAMYKNVYRNGYRLAEAGLKYKRSTSARGDGALAEVRSQSASGRGGKQDRPFVALRRAITRNRMR